MNFTEFSADELRNIIIDAGFPEGEYIRGKSKLAEFIINNEITISNNSFSDNVELEESDVFLEHIEDPDQLSIPKYNSPEWNDFLIGQLGPGEVDPNGHPLLVGLRRLAEDFLGEVIFSGPVSTSYNISGNGPNASCNYEIQIVWRKDLTNFNSSPTIKTFRALGDCCAENADHPWSLFASAIAESRAEARAYRKALNLKIVTSEELSKKITIDKTDKISNNQLNFIKQKINNLKLKQNLSEIILGVPFERCTKDNGSELIRLINTYQADINNIPEEVKL